MIDFMNKWKLTRHSCWFNDRLDEPWKIRDTLADAEIIISEQYIIKQPLLPMEWKTLWILNNEDIILVAASTDIVNNEKLAKHSWGCNIDVTNN
jgi:hypothetical protein